MSARIVIHSLAHAKTALAAAAALRKTVTLQSAAGAGGAAGARWFLALLAEAARDHPTAQYDAVLDCADEPGMVLAALRAGVKRVRFTGAAQVRSKLAEIAAALDAEIEGDAQPALDLLEARDPETACRSYLSSCLD